MSKLLAARFENNDASAALLEAFPTAENIGIRWSMESFGIERIEVTIKAKSKYDLYDRMNNHLGHRLAVFSSWLYQPMSGWIVGVKPSGANRLTYIAKGPKWRHEDTYRRTVSGAGEDTNEVLETILTDLVDIDNGDFSDIDATGTDADAFQPRWPEGDYPSTIIEKLINMSDASGNIWDYWLTDEPFSGTSLRKYKPHFKSRGGYTGADWQVSRRDLVNLELDRSIYDYRHQALVYYGAVDGVSGANSGNGYELYEAGANFTGFGFEGGDRIFNITDGSSGKIDTVVDSENLLLVKTAGTGLNGGTDNLWQLNDVWRIVRKDSWYGEGNPTAVTNPLFERLLITREQYMNATQAAQCADALAAAYSQPRQTQSFVIGSPFILDGNGAKWPLWEVIAQAGGILRVNDLYPAAALFSETQNSLTSFFITALDYDHKSAKMAVHVDTKDGRLDARLKRASILGSEMVARY